MAHAEIDAFIGRYTPQLAGELRRARAHLRRLIPRGYEMVYDNYNALVFGFGPTPRPSEVVLSIAAYPKWLTLFFAAGRTLKDPDGLLEGSGTRVRSVRLSPPARLKSRGVQALLRQALGARAAEFRQAPPLTTTVRSVSAKQRPRRPVPK